MSDPADDLAEEEQPETEALPEEEIPQDAREDAHEEEAPPDPEEPSGPEIMEPQQDQEPQEADEPQEVDEHQEVDEPQEAQEQLEQEEEGQELRIPKKPTEDQSEEEDNAVEAEPARLVERPNKPSDDEDQSDEEDDDDDDDDVHDDDAYEIGEGDEAEPILPQAQLLNLLRKKTTEDLLAAEARKRKTTSLDPKKLTQAEFVRQQMAKYKLKRQDRADTISQLHEHIIRMVAEYMNVKVSYIMEGLLDKDRHIELIENFLEKGGSQVLIFINAELQPPELETGRHNPLIPPDTLTDRFIVTDGKEYALKGLCVAAYRLGNKTDVSMKNLCEDVFFVTLNVDPDATAVSAFYSLISQLTSPSLRSLEEWEALNTVPPGHSGFKARAEFMETVDKFEHFLNMTSIDLNARLAFEVDEDLYKENLLEPEDVKASSGNYEIMIIVRDYVQQWFKQIQMVVIEANQIRREDLNCGPSVELEYWRRILAKYESVIEFLNTPQCRMHLMCATLSHCRIMKKWLVIDNQITDARNEAFDNVKYLTALQRYLDPLYRCDPVQILESLVPLMFTVRMIAANSRYFNTSGRLTSLLGKVTNQLISRCKIYLTDNYETNIWLLRKKVLLNRIQDCFNLYDAYLEIYNKMSQEMEKNPNEKPFLCSNMILFGRFKIFLERLTKIAHILKITNKFSVLQNSTIEGISDHAEAFADLFLSVASKTYDPLAHRKPDFDDDFEIFKNGIDEKSLALKDFVGENMLPIPNTENGLLLLNRFKKLNLNCLRVETKYLELLQSMFLKEIEDLRDAYNELRVSPPIPRNSPPVSGRIMWVRSLYKKMEESMNQFKSIECVIKHKRAQKCIKQYNCLAGVFVHYEIIYHQAWCSHIMQVRDELNCPILIRDKITDMLLVNMNPYILEAICETEHMIRLGLEVPDMINVLSYCKETLQSNIAIIQRLIDRNNDVRQGLPKLFIPLLRINLNKLDNAWAPGLATVSWSSTKIPSFCETVTKAMDTMTTFVKCVTDMKEARIERIFDSLLHTCLVYMPDEPLLPDEFVKANIEYREKLQNELNNKVGSAETAAIELVNKFITTGDMENDNAKFQWMDLDRIAKPVTSATAMAAEYIEFKPIDDDNVRNDIKSMHIDCIELFAYFYQQMTETLVKMTRSSVEAYAHRAHNLNPAKPTEKPLMLTDMELMIPIAVINPTLETCQTKFSLILLNILEYFAHIDIWGYRVETYKKPNSISLPVNSYLEPSDRNYYKCISENKDVLNSLLELKSFIFLHKPDLDDLLGSFKQYAPLWDETREDQIVEFVKGTQMIADIREKFKGYDDRAEMLKELDDSHQIGCLQISTKKIKLALIVESNAWKNLLGRHLSLVNKQILFEMVTYIKDQDKILSKPLNDLDDVRIAMGSLESIRENFIGLDMALALMEETYALFADFHVPVHADDNERIYSLRYNFNTLLEKTKTVQEDICSLQGQLQKELETGMFGFALDVKIFMKDYDENGPMIPGIPASEASDRVMMFYTRFEELWRRYEMYSNGQKLFGLPVTDYPQLQKKQKDFGLLNKLYSLYLLVNRSIDGYYDMKWADVDTEVIIAELAEFQNLCRRLPKAMTDWPAYKDLKKKIDDFNETCPLLELMANTAMKERHWKRLEELTGCVFDVESEAFTLQSVMEAPLLQFKDDVEDICIGAIKEKDIDIKFKQVIADWSVIELTFSNFKSRGELLVKGTDVTEIIALLEDSLMVLNSLLSNRYVAPMKKDVQLWVWKLVTSGEVLEKWVLVQSLWVYLEAVFVGGDIAKQLPAEAKRFSTIDKTWVKIMYRARDNPICVECCVGDETMINLLPFLLEQLETCQKSLTGYLEQKRLCFPRFFFISDPVMLEILGQASDPHAIQPHLLSIFDAVATVEFNEKQDDEITALLSALEERVPLGHPVLCRGGVEVWLGSLLASMKETIKDILSAIAYSLEDPEFDFVTSFVEYCGQAGLVGIQLLWTTEAEQAISTCKVDGTIMRCTNQRFLDILNSLIELTVLDLTAIQRTCYETMVTIHVHQRDIFDDMVRLHIRTTQDFEWQKQSRFYFNDDTDDIIVKITDVDFIYQDEYLGVTERLAVTPLTDRCYVTLAQSIGMCMGGSPAGPAGTGKTETTKDMGRALGKLVVVFNCSDQMDFRGLGRIFKGLAQSGTWGCFDEFNRIELPVLSVAAQQIYIVLTARKEHKKEFVFSDGDTVSLDPEFGLFTTMNPGYAGRQELPENLKIQFRTVAMMVPDRQIIIRVRLASCGFKENIPLSRKFFTLYKLCEEQLSKQVHYDFGLRNILSVLRTLGAQKRANPKDSEETTLMRVLKDMNVSKLIDEDEPLFLSLIDDMFPGIKLTHGVWKELQGAITNQSAAMGVLNHDEWNLKIVQLYETSLVRHGLMILGPTGSGKSTCIHCLQRSFTELGKPTKEFRMNPKAITASQMFGKLDVATNDWTDGIFSTLWRRSLKLKKTEYCWLVLDGPVDAVWIENLNSVLDDNKTLTLANGDRITMSARAKLVFEPDNVDNASPATISRMGMVFISSSVLNWMQILQGWLKTRPAIQAQHLENFFNKIYDDLHTFVQIKSKPKMAILEAIYIRQCCDLLTGLLDEKHNKQADDVDLVPKVFTDRHLEKLFLFSVMWSLGSVLELDGRNEFQLYALKKCTRMGWPRLRFEESIFEYVVDENGAWQHWNDRIEEFVYPEDSILEYSKILVPNVDNVRTAFLIHIIAKQGKAVLLIGEQGTAKTVMLKSYMSNYNTEFHLYKSFNFSSATTPNMFQRIIESYVDKRVGTKYGPPNQKKMTIFIDDINMPVFNEWGDQVTNEIVRQLMETSGFYSLDKPGDFSTILDVQLVAAMIHPGGGRNDIPPRLKRQFNVFNCALPSVTSMDLIFRKIGEGYFCSTRFDPIIAKFVPQLIPLTRILWQQTKVKMLPTPAKFHYVFNLRDLSRIWQGILTIRRAECKTVNTLMKLWKHECTRVIADRFTNFDDRNWFMEDMKTTVQTVIGNFYPEEETYFVDFLREPAEVTGDEPDDFDFDAPKIYEEIPSVELVLSKVLTFMEVYNEQVRGANMDLVFFHDAMVHLLIISRIVRMPRGNALLVGVGGSGKQSLTKLATFIANYQSFQISMTRSYNAGNLQDDLKTLYRIAGQQGKGITFLFTDNDIKDEGFLEYLNNVLSSGEIANLFPKDELDEITNDLIHPMKQIDSKRSPVFDNLYDFFISRARNNLHVVLCFSPVGEKFRSRSLKFPGLISGCTVDWFQRWPKDALIEVSEHFLGDFTVIATPEIKTQLIYIMGEVQDYVAEQCVSYFERFRRQTHVTPKSFLAFLEGYKTIYTAKHDSIAIMAERMQTGLVKLVEAGESVAILRKELEIKDKEIRVASNAAEIVLVSVTKLANAAEAVKKDVLAVKDKAAELVKCIAKDTAVAEKKLAAARPALAAAEAALLTIKAADIATVRKLGKPPYLITLIMDAVLILFKRRLEPVKQEMEKKFLESSWASSLKLMSDAKFLAKLIEYPKDTINGEIVDLLQPYLKYPAYTYQSAKTACGNVAGLIQWTMAMATFYGVNKDVLPLKLNLATFQNKYNKAKLKLDSAEALLQQKEAELAVVQAKFDKAMGLKQIVLDDAAICQAKMDAAVALIDGLAGERIRWTEQSTTFQSEIERLIGDVLILTGFLSYAGPFNQEFRTTMQTNWIEDLLERKMPVTMNLSILDSLSDTATIGEWNLQGLPTDDLSIQNGIIVTKAARFPLLIDPQGQGKTWINNLEKENNIIITTLEHKYFRNHIEDAISLGLPILIEDVEEELDPVLDDVLEKNYIKIGNTYKVKVGDKEVDVMEGFRMYITTKLPNPAYTPEIYARTSIVDFTVTMQGLEDQLLGRVILTEKNELETERMALIQDVSNNRRKMKQLEANLLHKLTTTKGSLVDDVTVIGVLNVTKATANEVSVKLDIARETEVQINSAREEFRPVATRGSVLYFLIVNVSLVNCMYQTSLNQFLERFDLSMSESFKSPIPSRRIKSIIAYLTYDIFKYTCRGLYECHKYMFTLMMTLRIDIQREIITHDEFGNFIKGGAALNLNACPRKPFQWITDMTWLNLVQLSSLRHFQYILQQVENSQKSWKAWFGKDYPEDAIIPDGYHFSLDVFRRLLLLRAWCPDRTLAQSTKYISWSLGPAFAEPVVLNYDTMYLESRPLVPMICFLSMGADPTPTIEALAKKIAREQENETLKVEAISMGQGQEVHARELVASSMEFGQWVLLQNCHLGLAYMTELLLLLQDIEKTNCAVVHEDFRIWMTTEEHEDFPISLLQMSLKFTNEPPSGIKAGLKRTYASMNQDMLDYSDSPLYIPLIFAVSFLHTVVQERRKFGPLGWNIPYEFNSSDWLASCLFLQNHLDAVDPLRGVSWNCVRYMLGEVQYGGRVTDDYDKRLLTTICKLWFTGKMFDETFEFYTDYKILKFKQAPEYLPEIDSMSNIDPPQAYGLHSNADITYQSNTTAEMLETILSIQPKESGGGAGETREVVVSRLVKEMQLKLPEDFDPFEVKARLMKSGNTSSMNIFLRQEIDRMQKVISLVRQTFVDLLLAIDGIIIMNEALRDALDNIYDARIPNSWKRGSWVSSTLGFWFTELLERCTQFNTWCFKGRPAQFWMTGFFNPQGFLTAMRQEVARAHKGWALDAVTMHNDVTKYAKEEVRNAPNEGVYVYGLYMDGAGYDKKSNAICESTNKVLFTIMPVMHIYAINSTEPKNPKLYECPVYKKPQRTDLTFITPLWLNSTKPPEHWTMRGVALLCDIK